MLMKLSQTDMIKLLFAVIIVGALCLVYNIRMAEAVAEETCPHYCADGFYDDNGWEHVFAGARANMESADPQLPGGGFSIMRVALGYDALQNPNALDGFVEMGWVKYPDRYGINSRFVYASWKTSTGVYSDLTFFQLADGDFGSHTYQASIKKKGEKKWIFFFDGVRQGNTKQGNLNPAFKRTANLGCGGETTSDQNAIGIAACLDVSYWSNSLVSWNALPSHLKRVSTGYFVTDLSPSSWQVGGKN